MADHAESDSHAGSRTPDEKLSDVEANGTSHGLAAKDEHVSSTDDVHGANKDTRDVTGFKWFLICLAVFSANLLYGLDTTIAADIQAPVAETFNEVSRLGWLGIGFTLGSVVFILPLGKAYAVFDTKWLFIGCIVMFEAGSALCGGAPSMNAIIIGRVWAGAGGAGMYLGNINLITILTTPKEQPAYIGLIGLIYGSGCILGPVVGGLLSDSAATWRWAFYLNLLIFAVMAPVYVFMLPSLPRRPGTTFKQRLASMDWLGMLLNGGMYVAFVLFCTFGGTTWPWNDGRTIACIVVFVVLLVAFSLSQIYCVGTTVGDRLFPCEMVMHKQLVLLYIIMACGGAALFVAVYYIPLYFQFVAGEAGTQSAVELLPFICFYVFTIILCGSFMDKTGYYGYWYLASGIFIVIGSALMYTVTQHTPYANIHGYSVLLGLGMATTQAGYAVGPTLVKADRVHEVIQFMNISQGQSQLLGLTIASAIFQSLTFDGLHSIFAPLGYSDEDIRSGTTGARSKIFLEASPETRSKALDVIVNAIDNIYIMMIAAGALYVVCSAFLPKTRR